MTARDAPPFRADHVGSLLRPPQLLRARDEFAAGAITADQLRAAEDAAIADAVRMQQEAGLRTAAPPGTWISSTRSAASGRPPAT